MGKDSSPATRLRDVGQHTIHSSDQEALRWKHLGGNEPPHISGKRLICGHTPQSDGVPLVFHGWVCLDTLAHGGGWLTALDVSTSEVFQASENRRTRTFPLSRYA